MTADVTTSSPRKTNEKANKNDKPSKDDDDGYNSSENFEGVVKDFVDDPKDERWLFMSLILMVRGYSVNHEESKMEAPDLSPEHFMEMN